MRGWFKLDNAAKIYPASQTGNTSSMFRLSVELTEDIDPETLAEAQVNALKRFPSFACRLRRGFFWYYLERIGGAPPVSEDIYNPMQRIWARANRHFMYRLLYYKNRIAVEFFHALTDGTGGMTYLMSLTAEYLRLKYGEPVVRSRYVLSCEDEPCPEEYEDSFFRYVSRTTIKRTETVSYRISGELAPLNRLMIISGKLPTDALKAQADARGVSIGAFLAALLLFSLYKVQRRDRSRRVRNMDVKVSIPINLRRFFPSRTLRNFSSYVNPGISSRLGEFSFDETLEQVKHFMGMHIVEKELSARISANVATERNIFVRLMPLVLKKPIIRAGAYLQGDRYMGSTLSNMGVVTLSEGMSKYVTRVDFMLGHAPYQRCHSACVSYGGSTVINFTRTLVDPAVEREFFGALVEMGVPVFLDSNGRS